MKNQLPDLFRPKEISLPRGELLNLVRQGRVTRLYRGIYSRADYDCTENITLAAVAKAVPNGIFCLLTALRFHNIGTQDPSKVWIAVHFKAHKPERKDLPLHVVRFSGDSMVFGVQEASADGVPFKITDPARTVADCFRYRNKIGLDVALEALREAVRSGVTTRDRIRGAARAVGGETVIRPYLEALSA